MLFYLLYLICKTFAQLESVDYVNPYLGGIPPPKFDQPTFPYIGLPGGLLRIYPPRIDFTTDFLSGIPISNVNFKSNGTFKFSPQQASDSTLIRTVDFSFDLEKVTPYNYSVYLDEAQIQVL
jgi:hypothetical protein